MVQCVGLHYFWLWSFRKFLHLIQSPLSPFLPSFLSTFLSTFLNFLSHSLPPSGPSLHTVSVSQLESDGDYAFPICELPHLLLISRSILCAIATPNIGKRGNINCNYSGEKIIIWIIIVIITIIIMIIMIIVMIIICLFGCSFKYLFINVRLEFWVHLPIY